MPASRITNKKSYNVTSNETRKQFIERVFSIRKKSIKDVSFFVYFFFYYHFILRLQKNLE